jgi:hypothetical protein
MIASSVFNGQILIIDTQMIDGTWRGAIALLQCSMFERFPLRQI